MDGNWGVLEVQSVVQVGSASASGIITDDSETLGLDNLEFEVAGGNCETADRGIIS